MSDGGGDNLVRIRTDEPEALFHQALDLWVNPELSRRREAGILDADFSFEAAQMLFDLDGTTTIRLNDEVNGALQVILDRDVDEGEPVLASELTEVRGLLRDDPDSEVAIVTIMYREYKNQRLFTIISDWRYNLGLANATFENGLEYLSAAQLADKDALRRPFVECLLMAMELFFKAEMLVTPDSRFVAKTYHGDWIAWHQLEHKRGRIEKQSAAAHQWLLDHRNQARYSPTFSLEASAAKELVTAVKAVRDRAKPKLDLMAADVAEIVAD